jgi:hypothetical protein
VRYKKPTAAQIYRFDQLKLHGCIACKKDGYPYVPAEMHHLVEGYRLGHDFTIPLCAWHHRQVPDIPVKKPSVAKTDEIRGPSLVSKRRFIDHYGTERQLLEEINIFLERSRIERNSKLNGGSHVGEKVEEQRDEGGE